MQVKYVSLFYKELSKYLSISDGFSLGQKLAQIEKFSQNRFINMTDEDIFNTVSALIEDNTYFEDEKMTQIEFEEWLEKK